MTATTVSWAIRDPLDHGGMDVIGYTVQFRLEDTNWDKAQEKFWPKGKEFGLIYCNKRETGQIRDLAQLMTIVF